MTSISRRDLLKLTGAAAVAPMAPAQAILSAATAPAVPVASVGTLPSQALAFHALTASEAEVLDALVARLIPSDANGPGAREANALGYIDRALAGALSSSREAYRTGLAALNRYAQASRGAPFASLSPTDQDSVLIDVETGAATGFQGSSAQFFGLVRTHTWQGMFGDPYYGGNANFVGWDLLGYPGVRTYVGPEEQRLDVVVKPNHKSAYDDPMFDKAVVSGRSIEDRHGD
jgi:gluconate 2-dehydrogenase gamma chain